MANPEASGESSEVLRGDAVGSTLYSERWILKQLIRITKFVAGEEELTTDFEKDLCTLWDMCTEEDVIVFVRKHDLIGLAVNTIMKSQSPRLSEIMVGIIGNMCTLKIIREECKRRADVVKVVLELLAFPDGPTLIQVMRVLKTFAWEVSNCRSVLPSPERIIGDGEHTNNHHDPVKENNESDNSSMHNGEEEEEEEEEQEEQEEESSSDEIIEDADDDDSSVDSDLSDYVKGAEHDSSDYSHETWLKRYVMDNLLDEHYDLNKNSTPVAKKHKPDKEPDSSCELKSDENKHDVIDLETGNPDVSKQSPIPVANVIKDADKAGPSLESAVCVSKPETSGDCVGSIGEQSTKNEKDENPEVTAVSVADSSAIASTVNLWYVQFIKIQNWLPEIVYILESSKNDELISVTWSLLSILCYIRVNDSFLCCKIANPDMLRALLESFKEYFGQHADLDNSEIHDLSKCRTGLVSWTSVLYSYTFHEDCKKTCCLFKPDILKNVYQMLTLFTNFLPVDGDLNDYLIHSFSILDHISMTEPYELSSLRWGINGVIQLLDNLTEEKRKRVEQNADPHNENDAIGTTENFLKTVLVWLDRLHDENLIGEYGDVREKLKERFG